MYNIPTVSYFEILQAQRPFDGIRRVDAELKKIASGNLGYPRRYGFNKLGEIPR